MKASALLTKILLLLIFLSMANAGQLYSYQERVIICMLPLEHADAEQLADVLAPFLSPQGKITAYSPTNILIIKDQPSDFNPITLGKCCRDLIKKDINNRSGFFLRNPAFFP